MFKVYQKHMQIEHQVTIERPPEIPKHRKRCKKSKKNELICGICKKRYLSRAVLKKHEAQHGKHLHKLQAITYKRSKGIAKTRGSIM